MLNTIPASDFENAATADAGIFAPFKNGNPRNSKGMAGKLFKPSRFYAERLAGKSRKNGACERGAVKLWEIIKHA